MIMVEEITVLAQWRMGARTELPQEVVDCIIYQIEALITCPQTMMRRLKTRSMISRAREAMQLLSKSLWRNKLLSAYNWTTRVTSSTVLTWTRFHTKIHMFTHWTAGTCLRGHSYMMRDNLQEFSNLMVPPLQQMILFPEIRQMR